jgi:surface polysaccharide O-acyltransferase-like enzyme
MSEFICLPANHYFLASLKITAYLKTAFTQIVQRSFSLYIIHVSIATLLYTEFKFINAVNPIGRIVYLSLVTATTALILNPREKKRGWINAHL